jgi:MFS transporter, OFA family, oxalate/formate antiporter
MTDARSFYGWKLLIALATIVAVNLGVSFVGAGVINAPMARDLHLSRGTLGLGSTAFILVNGLMSPVSARVINALGVRLTLCIGCTCTALGALLLATWVSQGWQFVTAYGLLLGMGCAFGSLIPAQTCATVWFERRRVLALALVLTGSGLGGSISAPLMTRIIAIADGNWRAGWYFVLAAGLSAALVALLFVRNRPGDRGELPDGGAEVVKLDRAGGRIASRISSVYRTRELWSVRQAVRTPALWLISLAAIGESASSTAALAHAVPHLRELGHSAAAAAAAMSLFSICTIAGKLSIGFLCDRLEPRNAWSACIMMMALAIWVATRADSAAAMFLFTGLLGFGSGAALTCWHATVANYYGPGAFASILGAQMPFSNAFSAAAPFLVGLAYDAQGTYSPAFYVVAAFTLVSAIMLLGASAPHRKRSVS